MRRIRRRLARWRRGRGAQVAAVLAAAALAVGGGYGIGFVATRPAPSPTPTPEPTPTATATATATPTPTPTPTATATPTPTPTVTPLPSPTPPRSTLPPSTPRPTPILPLAAGRVGVRLFDVGLDAPDAVGSLTRTISFTTDRVGDVSATLSRTTGGTVELCVVPAAPGETPRADVDHDSFCDELTNGSVHGVAPRDRQEWTVTLDATSGAPETDLTITFPSATRAVRLAAFRFEAGRKGYNGFTAQLTTSASGALRIVASWSDADGDSTHDYGVSVVDTDGSTTVYRTAGTDSGMDVRTTLAGRRRFQVRVENRDSSAEAATLGGSLTWP